MRTTKEEELREEFVNWCRFEFSSNEGNQIADWWLQKHREAIAETVETILDFIWENRTATSDDGEIIYAKFSKEQFKSHLTQE